MLVMMVGLAMTAVIVPILITQDRSTVFVASREQSLAAAQTGLDVVVGRIRAANVSGSGDTRLIPCAPADNPVTGAVGTPNSGSTATYRATVTYYIADPVANPGTPPMICIPNGGTYDPTTATGTGSGTFVPGYALISSTGVDGTPGAGGRSTGRTLGTTYVFRTTNRNVAGGQVRIYPPAGGTSSSMCLDAGPAPTRGTPLTLKVCSSSLPPARQQVFAYRADLTLQLAPSATSSSYPNGLCLDTDTSTGAPVSGNPVTLSACTALGSAPPFSQLWSFNDNGQFEAALAATRTNGVLANLCVTVADQTSGRPVTLAGCNVDGRGTTSPMQAWLPSPNVGNGAAAAPQLVNFEQFGRCLDVTGQNVAADHLIAYPCKQNPLASAVTWNQKFTFDPTSGWLSTTTGGIRYCLSSPRTEGGYVRITDCTKPASVGATAGQLVWRSPGGSASLPYSQRYTFVDSSTGATRCLSVADPPASITDPWSWIAVASCTGGSAQKWNADPSIGGANPFQNTIEK